MTRQEFAKSIKQKYPQYSDMDENELVDSVLAKYPVYRGQVDEKSTLKKIGDFFASSTQKFGKTLGTAASSVDPYVTKMREESIGSTQKMVDDLLQRAKTETDKEKAKKILESAKNLAETDDIDIFNNKEYQKTAKQIYGEALGTLIETTAFSNIGNAGKAVKAMTTGGKALKAAGTGAKISGAFGTGIGVSGAMQQDKSWGDVAKQGVISGAIGAGGGAVLGAGLSVAGSGVSALRTKAQQLKPIIKEKVGDAVYNKLNKVSRDLLKMSPTASKNEAKWNKNTPKFLVDEGIIPLIESDGKKISTQNALSALKDKYYAENSAFNNVLADSGEWISLNKLKQKSLNALGGFKSKGSDLGKAKKYIQKEIQSYIKNYRDVGFLSGDDLLVPANKFNEIKSGLWSKTSNFNPTMQDKLLSDVNYIMGHQAKDLIEETISDSAIKSFNSRLGDFASATKVLQNAEGKVVPGGFFGKQFTKLAGTIAGSGGGVPGSIVGNLTGGALADLTSNPQIKTKTLYKILETLRKTPGGQSIVDDAMNILQKRGEDRASRLLLQAPKTINLGAKADTSRILTQDEINATLKAMGIKY